MDQTEEKDRAKDQAAMQFNGIEEMILKLREAEENGDEKAQLDITEQIYQDVLSVTVTKQYELLLCTGGPAVRIVGDLDNESGSPETVHMEYQDWGTPWTEFELTPDQQEVLLAYARHYYFEELGND